MKLCALLLTASFLLPATALAKGGGKDKELKENDKVTLPVYDKDGNKKGERKLKAKDAWKEINDWTDDVTDKFDRDPSPEKVERGTAWDDEVEEEVETVDVPQDPDQKRAIEEQERIILATRAPRIIEPQRLATRINEVAGDSGTFAIFRNGEFSSEGDAVGVAVNEAFSAGGFAFGKRVSLIEQSTRHDKNSKTTRTDVKALGTTVFVSTDGTINANKQFTRSVSNKKVFFVGVPISVQATLSGTIGADFNFRAQATSFSGAVAPFANVTGSVSAGLDVFFVQAGVRGVLTFIHNQVRAAFDAGLSGRSLTAGLRVEDNKTLLSGRVSVFARIRRIFRGFRTFEKTIFSFPGIVLNTVLFDQRIAVSI